MRRIAWCRVETDQGMAMVNVYRSAGRSAWRRLAIPWGTDAQKPLPREAFFGVLRRFFVVLLRPGSSTQN